MTHTESTCIPKSLELFLISLCGLKIVAVGFFLGFFWGFFFNHLNKVKVNSEFIQF